MKKSELHSKDRYENTRKIEKEIKEGKDFQVENVKPIHIILFALVMLFALFGESIFELLF